MHNEYTGVNVRFLRPDERFILSEEKEMPLVIEANGTTDIVFLQTFLTQHAEKLTLDIAQYGAVLLRGFDVASDEDFEKTVVGIPGFRGISEAFMSEEGRIPVGNLHYVLHTNAVYKTGGTVYLGGFHSENYYSPDVPEYICLFCRQPSNTGGETGLINMEKVYRFLDDSLKNKLEERNFFVSKWLVSAVAKRYDLSTDIIEQICKRFDLPILGKGRGRFILMYKPSVFEHPLTKKKALQINFFELINLNRELRKCFLNDYQGKTWFWHRFFWRIPAFIFKILEFFYVMFASFFYSPKGSIQILSTKIRTSFAAHKNNNLPDFDLTGVNSCFKDNDVKNIAQLMRKYYSSFLWKPGDVLLVDNRQVVHAGMPGSGPRKIRALIGNPIEMKYSYPGTGCIDSHQRTTETIGFYMAAGQKNIP